MTHQLKMGSIRTTTHSRGFTIVELIIVIVVIGILAALVLNTFSGAQKTAVEAGLKSDLSGARTQLKLYQVEHEAYPTLINSCPIPTVGSICLKSSPGNTYTYTVANNTDPQTYSLTETNTNGSAYIATNSSSPTATVAVDSWANWYSGIAATALAGKHVYKTDLTYYAYKTASTAVTSPQGATGLDPSYPSNMVLVSPQTNTGVDFSAYPAQNACKAIGGRLPNVQELIAIYAGRATYGNNLRVNDYYWSSTEYNSSNAYVVGFWDGSAGNDNKTYNYDVRCVSG